MARPTNKDAFAQRANADWLLRNEFEALNLALLEWDAGSGPFTNVLAAIDAIDKDNRIAERVPFAVSKGEGPASLLDAATRLRDLSRVHSKLLEVVARVDALKVSARDELGVAAAELAKERRQHMPDYMAQLVNAILAQGVTQQDIGVPSRKLAEHVVAAIRGYRRKRQPTVDQSDIAHEVLPPEAAIESPPVQVPLPDASGDGEIPYSHLWRDLPREILGVRITEDFKDAGVAYASLPQFATIEEFVKPGLPLPTFDGTKVTELDRDALYLVRQWRPQEGQDMSAKLGIAASWALLLAYASPAARDVVPKTSIRMQPLQSPWHADCVIRFCPTTSPE